MVSELIEGAAVFGEPEIVKLADSACFTFVFVSVFDFAFVYVDACMCLKMCLKSCLSV